MARPPHYWDFKVGSKAVRVYQIPDSVSNLAPSRIDELRLAWNTSAKEAGFDFEYALIWKLGNGGAGISASPEIKPRVEKMKLDELESVQGTLGSEHAENR